MSGLAQVIKVFFKGAMTKKKKKSVFNLKQLDFGNSLSPIPTTVTGKMKEMTEDFNCNTTVTC